jgi:hypothetical protein
MQVYRPSVILLINFHKINFLNVIKKMSASRKLSTCITINIHKTKNLFFWELYTCTCKLKYMLLPFGTYKLYVYW